MEKLLKSVWGDVFAVIAGILFTLSFSPFDFSFLVFFALAFFRLSLIDLTVKRAVLRGFLFGFGIFGLGVSWVFASMVVNEQAGFALPMFLTLLYCSFWAIFPAISAYLYVKLPVSNRLDWLVFSSVWILVEYIRGEWVLGGFPWLQIAYSQLDSPLSGYIPVLGAYGTGLIMAMISALLIQVLLDKKFRKVYLLGIISLFSLGAILKSVDWVTVSGNPVKVSLIQGNIAQKDKWAVENRNLTLKQYYDDSVAHWQSNVIIWPETAIPAYFEDVKEDYLLPLEREAIEHNTDIITSLPYKDKAGKLYNSVLVLGAERAMYKKIHLLPFGEYLPWQPVSGYLLGLMNVRLGDFSSGKVDQPLLKVAGHHFVTSICYEDAFGEQSIHQVEQARFLVNVTNDGWFDGSIEPYQHMQIARMRALESGRYLLRVTNTGVSAIVDEKGKIIRQAPVMERAVITSDIKPMSGLTPYARIGNKPIILLIALILFCSLVGRYFLKSKD
ncbi:apolipoprotein N-acyltransferase [Methylococcaceae bacterium CS1]|nr:apolipoprotein N-acyltransferase [Methyloprofundus sp.]TXK94915.1 apolipoprotein N-acyltransferase [Methylococcaceae bacterium CS4]TXK99209.1 apolipoprotein N-acyltransferase [Methylococcaceae bacterium CS5]TXL04942.1 apolipoprotein N-acyltransferase [Methylococcaceae bacterium CS3]TXL08586.1 apolipoprotein N-acyltransferase [Methylococcaceae bacterium CS1]TXL12227.1 apolipoprotein N-acyltransferase [Methylococcaceae bacterium CS2]